LGDRFVVNREFDQNRKGRQKVTEKAKKEIIDPSMIYDLQLKVQVTVKQRGGESSNRNKRTLEIEKLKSMVLVW
jgi:hypothetical protein